MQVSNNGPLYRGVVNSYIESDRKSTDGFETRYHQPRPISHRVYQKIFESRADSIQELEKNFMLKRNLKDLIELNNIIDDSSEAIHRYLCHNAIRIGILGKMSGFFYKTVDSAQSMFNSLASDKFAALQSIKHSLAYEITLQAYEDFNVFMKPISSLPRKESLDTECLLSLPNFEDIEDEGIEDLTDVTKNSCREFIKDEFNNLFRNALKKKEIKKEAKKILASMVKEYNETVKKIVNHQSID